MVECLLYTEDVGGSIPSGPTRNNMAKSISIFDLSILCVLARKPNVPVSLKKTLLKDVLTFHSHDLANDLFQKESKNSSVKRIKAWAKKLQDK
jgi:hypothetical protein